MLGLTNPLSDRPDFSTQGSDFEMYQGWAGWQLEWNEIKWQKMHWSGFAIMNKAVDDPTGGGHGDIHRFV